MKLLDRDDLPRLLEALQEEGREVVGPTVRDGAVTLAPITDAAELPAGWTDRQAPGRYRLRPRDDEAVFGFVAGPDSWKRLLLPPREELLRAHRTEGGLVFRPAEEAEVADGEGPRRAFFGVRPCDLAAIEVQDRVFLEGPRRDPRYARRRAAALVVAVNCLEPGDLCFCASMGTGPRADSGYDLCLTEWEEGFLVEVGTDRGRELADRLPLREADPGAEARLEEGIARAARRMGRSLDRNRLPEILFANLDHPRWAEVAGRCLACGNCTLVCPTCFCSTVTEGSDLRGEEARRVREWDSCFTAGHGRMAHGTVRPEIEDRYRQWLTHKLGSWVSQYGVSGCVGCGRCIAWCPVGIDITEEVATIRAGEPATVPMPSPPPHPGGARDDAMVPVPARVAGTGREAEGVVTLALEAPTGYEAKPGQFNMLSLPGLGEAAISVSGLEEGVLEHTVAGVGPLTRRLAALEPGEELGLRGPFGSAWPLERGRGGPVVVIAGGLGLAPLRDAVRRMVGRPGEYPDLRLFYGARSPAALLYEGELFRWAQGGRLSLQVTVDTAEPWWRGHVGVVTRLLDAADLPPEALYLVCGPEAMMFFTLRSLEEAAVPRDRVHLSMERSMKCAAGFCGQCQYGPWFVCRDGPVFSWDTIDLLFGRHDF